MTRPRKVFGVGLNKTGTSTLGYCLTFLGYRHTSFSSKMLMAWHQGHIDIVLRETMKFESFEDWPWPLLYRDLFKEYEDQARYILTTRISPEAWLDSLKRHCLNTDPDHPMRTLAYGYKYPHGYEREHLSFYENHNQSVRDFFRQTAPEAFLEICWEAGDGWHKLCEFLGEPCPDTSLPRIRPLNRDIPRHIIEQNTRNIATQLRDLRAAKQPPMIDWSDQ